MRWNVPHTARGAWGAFACWLVASMAMGQASDNLLPNTTKAYLSIANAREFDKQWRKTQIGQLMNDPVMDPFAKDLRRQFEDRMSSLRDRLGLTLDDVKEVPSGELALATIQPAADEVATVLLMDVTGNLDKAQAMLKKAAANFARRGAKQSEFDVGGVKALLFEIAINPTDPHPGPGKAVYFLHKNLLGAADHAPVMRDVMTRLTARQSKDALAQVPEFRAVMDRCKKDAGPLAPLARWWIQPLGYVETIRTATPEQERRKGRTVPMLMRGQGFDSLKAIGGYVNFKIDKNEMFHRTAIYAPRPYNKSMKMLSLPNVTEFTPQRWVPRDVASYLSVYVDMLNAFDNFGPLFDEVVGEGKETGIWADVLQSLKDDPNGPRIDLRKELIAHLGNRITVISDYQLPITTSSERLLYAVEAVDQKAVAAAITKWMQGDPGTKRREFQGHVIWEMVEPEEPEMPKVNLEAIPSVTPGHAKAKEEEQEKEIRLLPHAAVTVAHGQLFIASHLDFLLKILPLVDQRKMLARDIDYQTVNKNLDKMGVKAMALRAFTRTDEAYRPTYELIKQGKMPESETMLARMLNAFMGPGKKGVQRKQKLDASKLPDYQVVRRYLGSAGMILISEPDGWFAKGFTLTKEQ
jgi:hypothetical protein